jgi:hypothetical protein
VHDATAGPVSEPGPAVHDIDLDSADSKQLQELQDLREDMGITELVDPLQALLQAPLGPPQSTWHCKRLKTDFVVRGLTSKEYAAAQEQSTRWNRNKRTQRVERDLDATKLSLLICLHGSVNPNFRDPAVLAKFGVQGAPHEAVGAALLPGEIEALAEKVLDVSGFEQDLEEQGKD